VSNRRLRGFVRPVASRVYFHPSAAARVYGDVAVTPGHELGIGVVDWQREGPARAIAFISSQLLMLLSLADL
jgi:hypothetical protein